MKKYLPLIVCLIAVMNMGCSTGVTAPAEPSPEAFDAVMAPIGGGSTANDWRNVTDGYWMYYFDYSESRLYRVNPALENAEMIYDGGYSWISLDGSDVWFWDWMDQLHHVSADGTEQVVLESEHDISASWFYEGSLYYLESPDYDVSLIKRLDLKTMEVTDLDRMINGTSPALLVSAGHIFFTEMMSEIDESYGLYRLDLDGTNEVLISDHAGIVQLFEDKLCYRNEDGLWAYSVVSGETERLRDDPGRPYFISDGMIYYNNTSGETAQLVCAPLYGGEETVLFPGHEASNSILIWGGMMLFDEFKSDVDSITHYYVGPITGSEAVLWDETIPSDYSGIKPPDEFLNNPDTLTEGTSWLYLDASGVSSVCYRLYDVNGALVQQVLLQAGESRTISFPSGYYTLKIAEGAKWMNDEEAFGPEGEYSSTSIFKFEAGSTYKIGSGSRGDFHGTDQNGF